MYVKLHGRKFSLYKLLAIITIYYIIDDNGGFIKEAILGVRVCCIDEIALASNALTNRGLTLSAI